MFGERIARLLSLASTSIPGETRADDRPDLVRARAHTMRLTARRSALIVSRVRLLAALLAILTPLWGMVDFWTLSASLRLELTPFRALASVAFAAIVVLVQDMHTLQHAYRAMAFLLAVLGAFFLYCSLRPLHYSADALLGFQSGCAYLPVVMLAGMAIFPLTAVECGAIVALVVAVQVGAWLPDMLALDWPLAAGMLGVLLLVGALSTLAALSQLAYLAALVREGIHDSLTGCYARRAGEELLDLQFTWARRSNTNLSVALVAPDGLQELNERFGYGFGDTALKDMTMRLHDSMRSGDMLVRWTGNEYLAVMPLASAEQAASAVQRLLAGGLGVRPDGKPITASIGIADCLRDKPVDWWMLVDAAMARARTARERGGNCTVARTASAT